MMITNWNTTPQDAGLIDEIVKRVGLVTEKLDFDYNLMDAEMDITACHLNGCKLDLQKLLDAPDFDFTHDVFGIRRHIDRTTGKLGGCFLPRCAAREGKVA